MLVSWSVLEYSKYSTCRSSVVSMALSCMYRPDSKYSPSFRRLCHRAFSNNQRLLLNRGTPLLLRNYQDDLRDIALTQMASPRRPPHRNDLRFAIAHDLSDHESLVTMWRILMPDSRLVHVSSLSSFNSGDFVIANNHYRADLRVSTASGMRSMFCRLPAFNGAEAFPGMSRRNHHPFYPISSTPVPSRQTSYVAFM